MVDVIVQLVETSVDIDPLPVGPVVKRNLLGVRKQLRVDGSVLTLELLFHSSQAAERRRNSFDHEPREPVPSEGQHGPLPSDQLGELTTKQNNVKHRLSRV